MFVIQFIRHTELKEGADSNDLPWATMRTTYETEEAAEDDALWHSQEEPAYAYRVVAKEAE